MANCSPCIRAEAADPEMAQARAQSLKDQLIFDDHVHFLRDDPAPAVGDVNRIGGLMWQRAQATKFGWNKDLVGREPTLADLKYDNFFKEIYLDSDTKVALLTNAPSDAASDWILPAGRRLRGPRQSQSRGGIEAAAGAFHLTPGQPGWLEDVDRAIEVHKPDGWKGYTIGDFILAHGGRTAWRMDDEKLMYPFYKKAAKAGIKTVCVHKGLFPAFAEQSLPHLKEHARWATSGKAAKDWPQLNFAIYHSGFRHLGGAPTEGVEEWQKTGRLSVAERPRGNSRKVRRHQRLWRSGRDLRLDGDRPAAARRRHDGHPDQGTGRRPRPLGHHSVWTGSPQWQIEAMRRLEIPEDMQKQNGFSPLGAADGPVKKAIFADNGLRVFGYAKRADLARPDRFTIMKAEYDKNGPSPSNLRYGYVRRS